jgi:hypothetical protein
MGHSKPFVREIIYIDNRSQKDRQQKLLEEEDRNEEA